MPGDAQPFGLSGTASLQPKRNGSDELTLRPSPMRPVPEFVRKRTSADFPCTLTSEHLISVLENTVSIYRKGSSWLVLLACYFGIARTPGRGANLGEIVQRATAALNSDWA